MQERKNIATIYGWMVNFLSISPQSTGYIIPPNGCLLVDNNEIRIDVLSIYPPFPHSWQPKEKIYSSGLSIFLES